jgi:hypothetical protein
VQHTPHGKVTPGRVPVPASPVFVSTTDGVILLEGLSRFATEVARNTVLSPPLSDIVWVTQFNDEYGFAFKRLPVLEVQFADGVNAYVDPADGAVAAVIDTADRVEGWVFGYVHKIEWLAPLAGTMGRDIAAALSAFALIIAAYLGLALYCG